MSLALRRLAATAGLLLLASPALAHHPMDGAVPATLWQGLASGIGHPVIGPDHLAFLMAVGLVAGLAGWGLARPLLFVLASLLGVASGWMGLALPAAEWIVAASVIVLGALLLARATLPAGGWMALLAVAGLAHGQAYAEAVIGAEASPVFAYLLGLGLVQGALVAGVALLARRVPALTTGAVPRLAGLAVLLVGVFAVTAQF
ncbi:MULTISPECIES: HupE/UreJ family protein [Roseomonadaceae]|uniref:HupE/UreJ family protein n=1 Tax=Falsiroseomonas oleicola TaxID=2801474 RepID=A0ABS6H491_9PROT|nr:HupE/UreJ family protein [Roseomonas oleicola]MBU8542543.1 HupE/UreJ family protein [Roseomonas oleicola]